MPAQDDVNNSCPDCGGVGYRIIERDGVGYAKRCECAARAFADGAQRRAQIPERFHSATFESFETARGDNPIVGKLCSTAFVVVKRWARDYPASITEGSKRRGLLLTGPPGVGKTHLAVAALKFLLSRGIDGVFYDYQTLLGRVARSWGRDASSADRETFATSVNADLLVIDDLGAQRALDWTEDIITDIINSRYNATKPVIVTTNLPDPALHSLTLPSTTPGGSPRLAKSLSEVIGERCRSRLFEMCKVVNMWGIDDYRLRSVSAAANRDV